MSVRGRGLGKDGAWDAGDGDAGTVSHFSSARLRCLGEGWGGYAVGMGDKRGKRY